MKAYVLTSKSHPWLLPAVEQALRGAPADASPDVAALLRAVRARGGRPLTDADVMLALHALTEMGVLKRAASQYIFDRSAFAATAGMREGIQAAVKILGEERPGDASYAQLCVSLPPGVGAAAEHVIHESSADLRSSLLDVIASASKSLIVASPFWDAGATVDMAALVKKKLAAGTQVSILGRFSRDLPEEVRVQLKKISDHPSCSVLSWYEGSGADTQTFHFKAISADDGLRGYLGSANMTVSSLRSRMELGVIVSGTMARHLDRILRVVLTKAIRMSVE